MSRCLNLALTFAAFAAGCAADSGTDDWLSFPSAHGAVLIHKDCVHRFDGHVLIEPSSDGGEVLSHGEERSHLPPCPYKPQWPDAPKKEMNLEPTDVKYYSDWVAYAQTTGDFGYMASDWVVPTAPTSTGPVPGLSSAYLFNGLEDGGGVHGASSYILQPVRSYGKSGCIIDPINFFQWHLISFSVTAAGRAYCGSRMAVKEGESVRGIMRLEKDGHTWTTLSVRLSTNETSTTSTDLKDKQPNAAYLTLESMINYNCKAFPASGSISFSANTLKDRSGKSIQPAWVKKLRHTECNQKVQVSSDGIVTISWDTGRSDSVQV